MIDKIRFYCTRKGFEVCSRLANFLGMRTSKIRLFFIYSCFFTLGFSFLVYLILAFLLRIKDLFRGKRASVFDI